VSSNITFPDVEPTYVFDRDCLAFTAIANGKSITCLVTGEFLLMHVKSGGMTEEAMSQAFRVHRAEIEDIARTHIENGWIDEENRVLLTTRYTRLSVTFSEQLCNWNEGRVVAEVAHRKLLEIIGPNAEEVTVDWGIEEPIHGIPVISVRITDLSLRPYSAKALLDKRQCNDPSDLTLIIAFAWADFLRARSHKLLLKSG
jgi:Protein of unknown function (DUF1488)